MEEKLRELLKDLPVEDYLDRMVKAVSMWLKVEDTLPDEDYLDRLEKVANYLPDEDYLDRVEEVAEKANKIKG